MKIYHTIILRGYALDFGIYSIIFAMVTLAGCALLTKNIKTYEGPDRPQDEIAIIKIDNNIGFVAIDGNRNFRFYAGSSIWDYGYEISILPGNHIFNVYFSESSSAIYGTYRSLTDVSIRLSAEAGHIYRIKYERKFTTWKAWIEDITQDEKSKTK